MGFVDPGLTEAAMSEALAGYAVESVYYSLAVCGELDQHGSLPVAVTNISVSPPSSLLPTLPRAAL